jgi:purine-binding chemotaxis protein CheW
MKERPAQRAAAIDWEAMRVRLERLRSATEAATTVSPEQARAIMEQRARQLALPIARELSPDELIQVLSFRLGRELYGVELAHVREVLRMVDVTPLPGVPAPFVGVINLRGDILPIIDLGSLYHGTDGGGGEQLRIIVLGLGKAEIGLLADEAGETRRLPIASMVVPQADVGVIPRKHILGLIDGHRVVLDAPGLLQDDRLFAGRTTRTSE